MMDGCPLFPRGHHPVRLDYTPDAIFDAPYLTRQEHPVKYYFIDFGISSHFKATEVPLVVGTRGRDKTPPELSATRPYNPFSLDVFILGNVYLKDFVQVGCVYILCSRVPDPMWVRFRSTTVLNFSSL